VADALLIVDKQNDYESDGGALTAGKQAQAATPYILELIRAAVGAGKLVLISLDTHTGEDPEFALLGQHCVRGEWGWELVSPLKALTEGERRAGRVVDLPLGAGLQPETVLLMDASRLTGKGMIALIEKSTHDLFHETPVAEVLRIWQVDRLLVAGQPVRFGVFHAVAGARVRGIEPVLLRRGLADFAPEKAEPFVEHMVHCLGAGIRE
jgi:nicotinamidase-related amidase